MFQLAADEKGWSAATTLLAVFLAYVIYSLYLANERARADIDRLLAARPAPDNRGVTVPIGAVIPYCGPVNIFDDQSPWRLCNRENSRTRCPTLINGVRVDLEIPDLEGKFVMGAGGADAVHSRGEEVYPTVAGRRQFTTNEAGEHRHPVGPANRPWYQRWVKEGDGKSCSLLDLHAQDPPHHTGRAGGHAHTVMVEVNGEWVRMEGTMRPKYYTLAYIMRVA